MNIFDKLSKILFFNHNQYFYNYIDLIQKNLNTPAKKYSTEKHHIIPICYYKLINNCKSRKEAEKFSINDNNFTINLSYIDHLKAHIYLCLSCESNINLKYLLAYAVRNTTRKIKEKHIITDFLTDCKLQEEYEEIKRTQAEGYSTRMLGNKIGKGTKRSVAEIQRIKDRNSGGRYINNGEISMHIKSADVDAYLQKGWSLGSIQKHIKTCKNTITINNGINEKRIQEDELSEFINLGWIKGRIKGKKHNMKYEHMISVYNPETNVEKKLFSEEDVNSFLSNNLDFKRGHKKRKKYSKCLNRKKVDKKGKIMWIHRNNETKMINKDELNIYLNKHWVEGRGRIKK